MLGRGTWRTLTLLLALALGAAGCTLESGAAGVIPSAEPAVNRADAASQLAALQASQSAALNLWDRLIAGEDVSCAEGIALPPPLTGRAETPQAEQALVQLAAARSALEQSAARWDLECSDSGAIVGLDAARAGQDAACSASEPLQTAQALLATWP